MKGDPPSPAKGLALLTLRYDGPMSTHGRANG